MADFAPTEILALSRILGELDYYQLLHLEQGASPREVKKAYHATSRAFHPDADQKVLDITNGAVLGFRRSSTDGRQSILVLANLSGATQQVELAAPDDREYRRDLLTGNPPEGDGGICLGPYQVAWLE